MINSARALHEFLSRLREQTENFHNAWVSILGSEPGSLEFAKQHGEVLRVFSRVLVQIEALPEATVRARYERYAPAWWDYIVRPASIWGDGNAPANSIIGEASLDILGSLADVFDRELPLAGNTDLTELSQQIQEWIEILTDSTDDIAAGLRGELIAQFRHLAWLIDHVGLVGVDRIVDEAQSLAGRVSANLPNVAARRRKRWIAGIGGLLHAVVLISGSVTITAEAIEDGANAIHTSIEAVQAAVESVSDGVGKPQASTPEETPGSVTK